MTKKSSSRSSSPHGSQLSRTFRKIFVSSFVIFTFVAYALHKQFSSPPLGNTSVDNPSANGQVLRLPSVTPLGAETKLTHVPGAVRQATAVPTFPLSGDDSQAPLTRAPSPVSPTAVPPTVAPPTNVQAAQGQYKDGQYTGDSVDVFYGYVQVKAIIQNGKIADIQFLDFPQDRRTSQRINSYAVPTLQQEAIQAQSANIDMISGATLTTEGFIQSLQGALITAQN